MPAVATVKRTRFQVLVETLFCNVFMDDIFSSQLMFGKALGEVSLERWVRLVQGTVKKLNNKPYS